MSLKEFFSPISLFLRNTLLSDTRLVVNAAMKWRPTNTQHEIDDNITANMLSHPNHSVRGSVNWLVKAWDEVFFLSGEINLFVLRGLRSLVRWEEWRYELSRFGLNALNPTFSFINSFVNPFSVVCSRFFELSFAIWLTDDSLAYSLILIIIGARLTILVYVYVTFIDNIRLAYNWASNALAELVHVITRWSLGAQTFRSGKIFAGSTWMQ